MGAPREPQPADRDDEPGVDAPAADAAGLDPAAPAAGDPRERSGDDVAITDLAPGKGTDRPSADPVEFEIDRLVDQTNRRGRPDDLFDFDDSAFDGFEEDDLDEYGDFDVPDDGSDPGCNHLWQHLRLYGSTPDLICDRCGRMWFVDDDPAQALVAVWGSAQLAFEQARFRHDQLSSIVETLSGQARCHVCERWTGPAELVGLGGRRSCPEHLGLLLDEASSFGEELASVAAWLEDRLAADGDLYAAWLLVRASIDCHELGDELDVSADRLQAEQVRLSAGIASVLGLGRTSGVLAVIERFAELLELPSPDSAAGRAVLLGVLARTEWARRTIGVLDDEALEQVVREAVPAHGLSRAMVVVDLYRSDMPEDGILTGAAVDDLVSSLVSRAASRLEDVTGR